LPIGNKSGNRFNEVILHDNPPINPEEPPIYPTVSYEATNIGKTAMISCSSGKGAGMYVGNLMSEISLVSNNKSGLMTSYLTNTFELNIGEKPQAEFTSGTRVATLEITPEMNADTLLGFGVVSKGKTKVHVKLVNKRSLKVHTDADYILPVSHTEPDLSYLVINPSSPLGTTVEVSNYELTITVLEGALYGGSNFYTCVAMGGRLSQEYLVEESTIRKQVVLKTNTASFIMSKVPESLNQVIDFSEPMSNFNADQITIPKFTDTMTSINEIGESAMTATKIGNRHVFVDATITKIVGDKNFRGDNGSQTIDIYINPNNRTTWETFKNSGYIIKPSTVLAMDINDNNKVLTTDSNGNMVWSQNSVRDEAIYLTSNNRIRAIPTGFAFEMLVNGIWKEISRIES
jgi:hypothetical protein